MWVNGYMSCLLYLAEAGPRIASSIATSFNKKINLHHVTKSKEDVEFLKPHVSRNEPCSLLVCVIESVYVTIATI